MGSDGVFPSVAAGSAGWWFVPRSGPPRRSRTAPGLRGCGPSCKEVTPGRGRGRGWKRLHKHDVLWMSARINESLSLMLLFCDTRLKCAPCGRLFVQVILFACFRLATLHWY